MKLLRQLLESIDRQMWIYEGGYYGYPNFAYMIDEDGRNYKLPFRILYDRVLNSWTITDSEGWTIQANQSMAEVEAYLKQNYPTIKPIPDDFIEAAKVDNNSYLQGPGNTSWDRLTFDFGVLDRFKPNLDYDTFIAKLTKIFRDKHTHFSSFAKFDKQYLQALYELYQKLA